MKRIVISIGADRLEVELNGKGGGTVKSNLALPASNRDYPKAVRERYNGAIDGIESLVLAHACAGIHVQAQAYVEGIQASVEAANNNLL
jgi:hypothetical protein